MAIAYRPSTSADLTYIRRLNYLTEVFGDESATPDTAEFLEASRFYVGRWDPQRGGIIAVDEDLDNPAGGAWLIFGTAECHGEGFVDPAFPELAIAVETRYQGRGVGTELMAHALDLARSWDVPGVSLCVHVDNPGARRVYERVGYVAVADAPSGYTTMVYRF
ncbi:GNAT family N-acetyltransferase [Corynebacterium uterequi]|uniref:Acetyltransferase n=1 Tax=Corynebacterium uterequi TaxID=1072256 RepID=A0A0G3HDI4_9CORY|nr:GNAT family N-acetyltransferase [Corynebacterium uterequi]AKK11436.1 acetyltransferase [Corynebacterium uterequi]